MFKSIFLRPLLLLFAAGSIEIIAPLKFAAYAAEPLDGSSNTSDRADSNSIDAKPSNQEPFKLNVQKSHITGTLNNAEPLTASVSERARILSKYQIELIIDRSLSMRRRDCPDRLSRWQWCGAQADTLARELAPLVPNGLTITTFAWGHKVYENATPSLISQIFASPHFAAGTRMAEPLSERINNFLRDKNPILKPLLIGVITDGVPHPLFEQILVSRTLVSASKDVADPHLLTVVFFQIGGQDQLGHFLLSKLGHGARYEIAHTVSFQQLQREGLAQALVNSIHTALPETKDAAF